MSQKLKNFLLIIVVLLFVYLLGFAVFIYFDKTLVNAKDLPSGLKVDAIVVLTGGEGRVATGVDLLKKGYAPNLFISGVKSKMESIPEVAKLLQTRIFWPEVGREAQNTEGNAIETKDWIQQRNVKTIILVTSNYHMLRSLLEFRELMPNLKIIPCAVKFDVDRKGWFYELKLMFKEYSKSIVVALRNCWKRCF